MLFSAAMALQTLRISAVLLAVVSGVHPPPDDCCDGPPRRARWGNTSKISALGAFCNQAAALVDVFVVFVVAAVESSELLCQT